MPKKGRCTRCCLKRALRGDICYKCYAELHPEKYAHVGQCKANEQSEAELDALIAQQAATMPPATSRRVKSFGKAATPVKQAGRRGKGLGQ